MLADILCDADSMPSGVSKDSSALRRRGVAIPLGHKLRAEAEAVIEGTYRASFDVRIENHYPLLVGVLDESGVVIAAAGCRIADEDRLFVENYLDQPSETLLARRLKREVARSEVAEIGNLATSGRGGAGALFGALAQHLHEHGVHFALATATRRLRRAFSAFGFGACEIARAEQTRMPNAGYGWNGYFAHEPVVVCGRVETGLARSIAIGAGH